MPAKNSNKAYVDNAYYHIYNRGVDKKPIFLDQQDYAVFLSYLKEYLLPKDEDELTEKLSDPETHYKEKDKIRKILRMNNFAEEISLLAYCLMPNHFHLLVKQKSGNSIDKFMNSLSTRYTMYFNRKYKRVGPLCQDVYKAVLVESDEQLIHLSRYIHQQALASQGVPWRGWEQPSSYSDYLGVRNTEWVKPQEVLSFFSRTNNKLSYEDFVKAKEDEDEVISIYELTLDYYESLPRRASPGEAGRGI